MTEKYRPTYQEKVNSKMQPDKLKVSGDGIFATFQGEGISIGKPVVFLRLQDCNLQCSWCDTPYTWQKDKAPYWQEPKNISPKEIATQLKEAWTEEGKPRLVISGGEPMIQQKKIAGLLKEIPEWDVEIETNGTIAPIEELKDVQFNVSPKLSNSGNEFSRSIHPYILGQFNALEKTNFKFVVATEQDIKEINAIVKGCGLDKDKILIMPEGVTIEALEAHRKLVEPFVQEQGYKMTKRLQIEKYGQRRRV